MRFLKLHAPKPARGLVAFAVALTIATLTGCGSSGSHSGSSGNTGGGGSTATPFAQVVFVGDSLTAGFQNGSLLDTQQPNGYAALVAQQAGFSITLPLIASPGAPAVMRLVSLGPPPVTATASGITTGRDNASAQPTDLAVPGHKVHDTLYYTPPVVPTSDEDIITQLVLGFPTGNSKAQADEAVALKPTTILLWAGNNDALVADTTGMPSSMTPLADFTTDYTALVAKLKGTGANLIVANVPDVTAVPSLTPATMVVTQIAAATKQPTGTIAAGLGLGSGDFVNTKGLADAQGEVSGISAGGKITALPDGDVLTAAEVATAQATVNSYNQVIQQQVTAAGGTLVDMHAYFATLAAGVSINGVTANNAYLGGLFSLDGTHPTNTGYALLANQFITALNTKLKLSIAAVDVNAVAAKDPYFPPNIKPTGKMTMSAGTAMETQRMMETLSQRPLE